MRTNTRIHLTFNVSLFQVIDEASTNKTELEYSFSYEVHNTATHQLSDKPSVEVKIDSFDRSQSTDQIHSIKVVELMVEPSTTSPQLKLELPSPIKVLELIVEPSSTSPKLKQLRSTPIKVEPSTTSLKLKPKRSTTLPTSKPRTRRRPCHVSTAKPETKARLFTSLLLNNIAIRDPDNARLICEICNYSALRRHKIVDHMNRFHTEPVNGEAQLKPFCCETCGIRMSEMGNLKKHMKLHTGHKPFPCLFESCDRRFFGSSERKIHMRRHLGEKPYQCDQCPDTFISKSQMSNHKRQKHSDVRPYHCDVCGLSFKLPKTFKDHQLTHTDIRQYHCDECGRSFRQRSAFQVHVNIHTDNRPYKCSICERGFHSSAARRSHEKTFHKKA